MQTPTSIKNGKKHDAKTNDLICEIQAARAALREAEDKLAKHLHLEK